MSTNTPTKINKLLTNTPSGVVLTSAWLKEKGYSPELQRRYRKSQWLDSLRRGALVKHNDDVDCLGAVYSMQQQLGLSIHPGAKTALGLMGKSHYLEFSTAKVQLFTTQSEVVPAWFKKHDWKTDLACHASSFLPPDMGLTNYKHKNFEIKISGPARAILECLYLAPDTQPLVEVYELMEGLNNLRPKTVQSLLESCTSVKVKRLFLYMSEKAQHEWLNYVEKVNISLGEGKRQVVPDGSYNAKYQITVPKELEQHL